MRSLSHLLFLYGIEEEWLLCTFCNCNAILQHFSRYSDEAGFEDALLFAQSLSSFPSHLLSSLFAFSLVVLLNCGAAFVSAKHREDNKQWCKGKSQEQEAKTGLLIKQGLFHKHIL